MTNEDESKGLQAKREKWMLPFIEQSEGFANNFPHLYEFLISGSDVFRGFSIIEGKDGGYLAVSKSYLGAGDFGVIFSHAEDPFQALRAANNGLGSGTWKNDPPWEK